MVKINMVVNKSPEIWSILSLADRLLFPFFPSVRFLARKEDPFHHARRLYLLSASTLSRASFGVQNDSLLYFTISLYHPISSSPLPPPRARGEKIKRGTNTILKPSFRGERTRAQPALNQRNIPVFEALRLGSRSLLSLSSLALFFLTHRIKKTGGRDTIRPYGAGLVSYGRREREHLPRQKARNKARATINEMEEGME